MSTTLSVDCKDKRVADSIRWLLRELENTKDGEVTVAFFVRGGSIGGVDRVVKDKSKG
jgi:hypothetical protein